MASFAPTRYQVVLNLDPVTGEWNERYEYWSETQWTPLSTPGMFVRGDQTALSADGQIAFLDCHVLPGTTTVLPFGEWQMQTVGKVQPAITIEEHSPSGTTVRDVILDTKDDVYQFAVTAGTQRVCTCPVLK